MNKIVLVSGATGRQGGATARHLLARGWQVRALVRDPNAPAARELSRAGAELALGDLDAPDTLHTAVAGAYGVFGVTPDNADPDQEVRRGRNLVDAAATANVEHFVFASVGAAERSSVPVYRSKWAVEKHIRALGLPATMLRPVRFMENHTIPGLPFGGIVDGVLVHLFGPNTPVQLIAADDIGVFAAAAFSDPRRYLGQAIELAGDELTPTETVELIGRTLNRTLTYRQATAAEVGFSDAVVAEFTGEQGLWRADIPALREQHPGLLDFPTWLERGGAARIEALF
ncbi:NmrA/HSCARG family protein [Micromonospora sp. NPDC003197]